MKKSTQALLAAMTIAGPDLVLPSQSPKKSFTAAGAKALECAEAKRERRRMRNLRLAKATTLSKVDDCG